MSEMPMFLVFLWIPFHCWLDHRERLFKLYGKDMSLLVGNILFEHTRKSCRSSSRNMFAQGFPSLIVGRRIMFYIELFWLACRSLNCTIDTEPWTWYFPIFFGWIFSWVWSTRQKVSVTWHVRKTWASDQSQSRHGREQLATRKHATLLSTAAGNFESIQSETRSGLVPPSTKSIPLTVRDAAITKRRAPNPTREIKKQLSWPPSSEPNPTRAI